MIEITKFQYRKTIAEWTVRVNGYSVKVFGRLKDAKNYIKSNQKHLSKLENSLEYKPKMPFDIPDETEMLLIQTSALYKKNIFYNKI